MAARAASPTPGGDLTHGAPGKRRHWAEGYLTGRASPSVKKRGAAITGRGIERPEQQSHEDHAHGCQRDRHLDSAVETRGRHLEDRRVDEGDLEEAQVAERRHGDVYSAHYREPG